MNEKIKELCSKAISDVDGIQNPDTQHMYIPDCFRDRFAELIVRECAELFVDQKYMILNPNEPFANERIRALKDHDMDTVRKIKGHFGVK